MNSSTLVRWARSARTRGALLVALSLPGALTTAHGAPEKPRALVGIVFPAGAATDPETDGPPRLREAAPIELPAKTAASVKPGTGGLFRVMVDEQGNVRDLEFAPSAKPGALAQPIRAALMRWKFRPLLSGQVPKAGTIPLAYIVNAAAHPTDEASRDGEPPFPLYRVELELVPALTRKGVGRKVPYSVNVLSGAQLQPIMQRFPDGRTTIVMQVVRPTETSRVEFLESESPSYEPWWSTSVTMSYDIDASGMPGRFVILDSSCQIMEPETIAAVRAWRFRPSTMDGKPANTRIRDTIEVSLPKTAQVPKFIRRLETNQPEAHWKTAPRIIRLCLPVYPVEHARNKSKGDARAAVHLDEKGRILEIHEVDATSEAFALALHAALMDTRFEPARTDDRPVRSLFAIDARFTSEPQNMVPEQPRLPAVLLTQQPDEPLAPSSALDRVPKLLVGRPPTADPRLCRYQPGDTVVLEITIDRTGRVKEPSIVSSPQPLLGYVAIQAVSSWLFEEPTSQGNAVATRVRIPLGFDPPAPGPDALPSHAPSSGADPSH